MIGNTRDATARFSRRALLGGGLAVTVARTRAAAQSAPAAEHGRVTPPIPPPDIAVVRDDGATTSLRALVRGRATALHPMFTSCVATCPIQGAIFARVQKLVPDQAARGIQLVSLSVDPRHDTPAVLRRWLRGFHARAGWVAAAPTVEADVAAVRSFTGPGRNPSDNHSTQVLILNRDGLLVWRTFELPDAKEIAAILRKV